MNADMEHYPEELEGLFAKIGELLLSHGIDVIIANEAAFAITEYIREQWGGGRCYFTKSRKGQPSEPAQDVLFDVPSIQVEPEERDHHGRLVLESGKILSGLAINQDIAALIAELVRADWAGQAVYVNKGQRFVLARRDFAIWREWDGSYNCKMRLMRKHGITEVRFYQIVAAVRRREFKRTQPGLPGVTA
jgi:Mor family transcriptional regulator